MAPLSKTEKEHLEAAFAAQARKMFFSQDSIGYFLEEATPGHLRAVCGLLDHEMQSRERSRMAKLLRQARFPVVKSVEEFDFSNVRLPDGYTKEELFSLEFVAHAQDFVFYGMAGRGKTHLSIAIGMMCVQKGLRVRFFPTADLVLQLIRALNADRLDVLLHEIGKADLIVLDEFGYIPIDSEGARLLFQVISAAYETRSLILTTNTSFPSGVRSWPTRNLPPPP